MCKQEKEINLKGIELVGTLSLVDKPAREMLQILERRLDNTNDRTKRHTLEIRELRKELKELKE